MATYTIYSSTEDGYIQSSSTSYSTARSGGSLSSNNTVEIGIGQNRSGSTRSCYEAFFLFDLSDVAGEATQATISLYGLYDLSTTNFTAEIRTNPWGGSLTTADWVAGGDLSGLTLLASFDVTGFSTSGYNAFTSEAAILTAVDLHGSLEVIAHSSRHRISNDPSGAEMVWVVQADASGTSQDPKIDIESEEAAGGVGARILAGPKLERMRLVA